MRQRLLIAYIFFSIKVFASGVHGIITDSSGAALPFVNIYVKGTTIGCASNEIGYYSFQLAPGKYTLVFQYLGFKKQEIELTLNAQSKELNVTMFEETKMLHEVAIFSDDKDPAYSIIREAIAAREEHLKENSFYKCEVYIKGLQKITDAPDEFLGIDLKGALELDSSNRGVIYLSESLADYYYRYPDESKEIMRASKVSGNSNAFSFNDVKTLQEMNIYKNNFYVDGLTDRSIQSPIGANAFLFYDYELISSFFDKEIPVYKIKVIPKRETDPVFTGLIYITGNDYHVYSTNLNLTKKNGISFIDTLNIAQEFVPSDFQTWVPISTKFSMTFSILGIKGEGYYNGFFKNYLSHPEIPDKFFSAEISRVEVDANKKDSIYWKDIRPIPLTMEEKTDYVKKDSLELYKSTDAYKDSIDKVLNKFQIMNLITGYSFQISKKDLRIATSSLLATLQYNTVEGIVLEPGILFSKQLQNLQSLEISTHFRYGFSLKNIYPRGTIKYQFNTIKNASVSMSGGILASQFNEKGIGSLVNSVETLLLEQNYLKIYRKKYLNFSYKSELFNGLYFTGIAEYANRSQLFNDEPLHPLFNSEIKEYTDNNYPFYEPETIIPFFDKFTIDAEFKYVIGQKYMSAPDKKYILDSKYPTLTFNYKKAIPNVFNSKVKYDRISFSVSDDINLKLAGKFSYYFSTGNIFNEKNITEADVFHFNTNETFFSKPDPTAFFIMPYYYFSTTDAYAEFHTSYHTKGFLFKKLPLFKELKLQPVFSASGVLLKHQSMPYLEFSAGLENIFKVLRIDFTYTPYQYEGAASVGRNFYITFGIGL